MGSKTVVTETKKETNFSDKLDVLKYVADIKLRINQDITSDFALAKLNDKDKEAIIEMTCNAYYSKYIIGLVIRNCKEIGQEITHEEYKEIKQSGDRIFDQYMNRIYMTVILNKNVDGNYLINVLSDYGKGMEEIPINEQNNGVVNQVLGDKKDEKSKI